MEKIKIFVIKYWKVISVVLCILTMIIITIVGNTNFHKNQRLIFETELINSKETLRDSMISANNVYVKHVTDSIQKSEKIISDSVKKKVNELQKESNKLVKQNKVLEDVVDSLLNRYGDSLDVNCNKVIYAYQKQVNGLKTDIFVLNKILLQLRIISVADSIGWAACKEQNISNIKTIDSKNNLLVTRDNVITDLSKQLSRQNGWLNKNKGWIGIGIGIIGGIVIMK